ncbi:MAG: hypothetical protein OEV22_20685, partial [Deltaproteobacteria bacterium]|nr:hypothetical protein [Deltaproteobacteria bacterium]
INRVGDFAHCITLLPQTLALTGHHAPVSEGFLFLPLGKWSDQSISRTTRPFYLFSMLYLTCLSRASLP